ncbi:MAG TPA: fibronectin type III domain-containing protein [Pseudonocardiaceae bacterium]|nr:fibronectin type III domain-containing protein [Pseudonocardiaceae bacterium]
MGLTRGSTAGLVPTIAAIGTLIAPGVAAAQADTQPPSAPTQLRVQDVSFTSATFTWSPSTDASGWVMYEVEASALPRSLQRFGSTEPRKTVTGLVPGLTYTASVVAVDGAGNRSAPASTQFTTPVDATPPTTPTNLRAVTVDGTLDTIVWNAATDRSALRYVVRSSGNWLYGTRSTSVTTFDLLYIVCVVPPGSTHTLTVEAMDEHLNVSARSNPLTVTFPS